jgi:hypothetical protein
MTTISKKADGDLTVQEHCIDLPGESVQCWIGGGTDKLKVILRKHRDVIFDIHLGNGKTYTLETTESDFYNARDKKLVFAGGHGKVTFKDGERMHVWVSRGFLGKLVLKSNGNVLYSVEPNEWDKHQHGEDPKEKPAPIIVAIGRDTGPPATRKSLIPQSSGVTPIESPVAAPIFTTNTHAPQEICTSLKMICMAPVVCVIEGTAEGIPTHLAQHFEKGGDHSGLSDIDPNHVATRNWIWGQAAGARAYVGDNWEWLRASLEKKAGSGFKLVKAQVHFARGKVRFYFSGYSNSNTMFGHGGYSPAHERIMTIFAGAGKSSSVFGATVKGIAGSFKENALVSFIFGSVTSIAEWKDDIHKDGYDLAAALIMTTIKAVVASFIITLVVAAIVWVLMIGFEVALGLIMVGIITIGVGVVANYALEAADKAAGRSLSLDPSNTDGIASSIAPWMRELSHKAQKNWSYLMEKFPKDYQEIQP